MDPAQPGLSFTADVATSKPSGLLARCIAEDVRRALAEDIGSGDLTTKLVAADRRAIATVTSREQAIVCGRPWFDEVFLQLSHEVAVTWHANDGDQIDEDATICELRGPAQPLLTGERTALNFLQTLSATATAARAYVDAVLGTGARILDTRKTLPGLRLAQKYAVSAAGAENHRAGLFDAVLIKENHIVALGGIKPAIEAARETCNDALIEVEVEGLDELAEALEAGPDRLLLDNFSTDSLVSAVQARDAGSFNVELEASGGITLETVRSIAETGVDFISVGSLTKDICAIDLSMRMEMV